MQAHTIIARPSALLPLLACGALVTACGDQRRVAASELQRLDEAMQQHAMEYGGFPHTIDPGRPATRSNLPYSHERQVSVRLIGSGAESYAATARRGVWLCGITGRVGEQAVPDCTPTGSDSSVSGDAVRPPTHMEGILDEPGAGGDSTANPAGI